VAQKVLLHLLDLSTYNTSFIGNRLSVKKKNLANFIFLAEEIQRGLNRAVVMKDPDKLSFRLMGKYFISKCQCQSISKNFEIGKTEVHYMFEK